jgi:hypothetical protein
MKIIVFNCTTYSYLLRFNLICRPTYALSKQKSNYERWFSSVPTYFIILRKNSELDPYKINSSNCHYRQFYCSTLLLFNCVVNCVKYATFEGSVFWDITSSSRVKFGRKLEENFASILRAFLLPDLRWFIT